MATYQSRDELVNGYRKLLGAEKEIQALLADDDEPPLEEIQSCLAAQTKIIEKIDQATELRENLDAETEATIKNIIEEFNELRNETIQKMEKYREDLKQSLEALDTSSQLMEHYMQGKKRDEEITSLRIDENF